MEMEMFPQDSQTQNVDVHDLHNPHEFDIDNQNSFSPSTPSPSLASSLSFSLTESDLLLFDHLTVAVGNGNVSVDSSSPIVFPSIPPSSLPFPSSSSSALSNADFNSLEHKLLRRISSIQTEISNFREGNQNVSGNEIALEEKEKTIQGKEENHHHHHHHRDQHDHHHDHGDEMLRKLKSQMTSPSPFPSSPPPSFSPFISSLISSSLCDLYSEYYHSLVCQLSLEREHYLSHVIHSKVLLASASSHCDDLEFQNEKLLIKLKESDLTMQYLMESIHKMPKNLHNFPFSNGPSTSGGFGHNSNGNKYSNNIHISLAGGVEQKDKENRVGGGGGVGMGAAAPMHNQSQSPSSLSRSPSSVDISIASPSSSSSSSSSWFGGFSPLSFVSPYKTKQNK